jgi:type I restriction-modification system DNA methylase subunit
LRITQTSAIGLPPNLFYGTSIPACIVVVDKQDAHARKGVFMIDASGGFMKDGPKNRLRAQDMHRIVDVFTRQHEVPRYSRLVNFDEIEKNDLQNLEYRSSSEELVDKTERLCAKTHKFATRYGLEPDDDDLLDEDDEELAPKKPARRLVRRSH